MGISDDEQMDLESGSHRCMILRLSGPGIPDLCRSELGLVYQVIDINASEQEKGYQTNRTGF